MEFHAPDANHAGFRGIHPVLAGFLRGLPDRLETLTPEAEQRFFPPPARGDSLAELCEDWKAHVEADLHSHFRSARDTVAADLRGMRGTEHGLELPIPSKHIDAWLNVLNQIRLALAEDFGLPDPDAPASASPDVSSERGVAMLQSEMFTFMQECLVRHLE